LGAHPKSLPTGRLPEGKDLNNQIMENNSNSKNVKPLLRRGLGRLPAWLKSKYFLCGAGFIIWMLFFDPRDIYSQLEHTRELNELKASKSYYQKELTKETAELEQLKTNPATLEKYAREKYLMKRENEDLFIISEKPDVVNK
jgi:hypothetical protein